LRTRKVPARPACRVPEDFPHGRLFANRFWYPPVSVVSYESGSPRGTDPVDEPSPGEARTSSPDGSSAAKSYGKIAKRGIVWSFFREGVSEMLTMPTAIIMARLLSPFDFGIAASTGFFVSLAKRLTNFGFNQALVRVKHLRPDHASSVFVVTLGTGLTAYFVLVLTADAIGAFFRAPQVAQVIPVVALQFITSSFGSVPAALMTRDMQFKRSAIADWIGGIGEALSAIWLGWSGYGFWSLAYSRVIGDTLNSAAKMALGGWRPSVRVSAAAMRELFSFGTGVFAKRFLDYAANNLDNVVVGRLLGVTALGFYDKAFMTMSKVLVRINTGGPMISFRIFALIHEERERFQRAFRNVVLATSLFSYPLLAALAASAPELIPVVYGARWISAVEPFQILCVAGALKVLNEYAGSALQASGQIWAQVSRQAVYTVLIVVFVAVLSAAGLTGAAWGVLVATTIMAAMMNLLLTRLTAISLSSIVAAQVPGILASVCVVGAIVGSRGVLLDVVTSPWRLLIVEMLVGAAAYALFLRFNRFGEVRRVLRDAANDLPSPLGRFVRFLTPA
jgi:O-antigen/teichoic acid export membrane protein